MWLFTEAADAFDQVRADNEKFLDVHFTRWVAHAMKDDTSAITAGLIYAGVGILYSTHKLSTEVAASYVDVLRIGDGVTKEKTAWGVVKDGLRATVVVSGVLRGGRVLLGAMKSVDMLPQLGNCSWVAATKVARMSGVKLFASIKDIAGITKFGGWLAVLKKAAQATTEAEHAAAAARAGGTGGAWIGEVAKDLVRLGAKVEQIGTTSSRAFRTVREALKLAGKKPYSSLMFSVRWRIMDRLGRFVMNEHGEIQWAAHTLIARRTAYGVVKIYDRSGAVVRNLAELEKLYPGISAAETIGEAALVHCTTVLKVLETAPSVLHLLGFETIPIVIGKPVVVDPRGPQKGQKPNQPSLPRPLTLELHEDEIWKPTTDGGSAFMGMARYWTYTVEPGDSLQGIAQKVYRKPEWASRIYQLNQGVVGPPPNYRIHPGQELVLPE